MSNATTKSSVIAYVYIFLLTFVIIFSATPAAAAPRYLSVHSQNELWLKEDSKSMPWVQLLNHPDGVYGIAAAESSNRIAIIDQSNRLWVKEGGYTSQWVLVAEGVYEAELMADSIYTVDTSFNLNVKVGDLKSGWLTLASNVYSVEVSPNRVLALSDYDGYTTKLMAKEGGLYSSWIDLARPISYFNGSISFPSFSVTDNRLAYFDGTLDNFEYKEGGLRNAWYSWVYTGEGFNVELYRDRMCINTYAYNYGDSKTSVACKDGSLFGSWITVSNDAYLNDITDTKITVRNRTGSPYPKDALLLLEGSLYQNSGWLHMDTGRGLELSKY